MAGLASDVSLQIYVKLSSVDGADVKSSDNDITTAEREVETNVAVTDRKALVISGLMCDDATEESSGVPFLRKLPGIGKLM